MSFFCFPAYVFVQYGEDCIIDMVCYRRMGHNEIDQPLFTQPVLYKQIARHPDTAAIFEAKLVSELQYRPVCCSVLVLLT